MSGGEGSRQSPDVLREKSGIRRSPGLTSSSLLWPFLSSLFGLVNGLLRPRISRSRILSSHRIELPEGGFFFVFREVISEHRKSVIEASESDPGTISGLYYPLYGDGITSASIAKVTTFRFLGRSQTPTRSPCDFIL